MITLEILGAIAASITIFTTRVAVGRYIEHSKTTAVSLRDLWRSFFILLRKVFMEKRNQVSAWFLCLWKTRVHYCI